MSEQDRPEPAADPPPIEGSRDIPYPGRLRLAVDATDVERGIFRVRQAIPVAGPGPMTLLYPKWLPGYHSPSAPNGAGAIAPRASPTPAVTASRTSRRFRARVRDWTKSWRPRLEPVHGPVIPTAADRCYRRGPVEGLETAR